MILSPCIEIFTEAQAAQAAFRSGRIIAIGILCGVITPLVHIVGRESRGSVPAVKFLAFTMSLVCFLKEHIFVRHVGGIGQRPMATW